MFRLFRHQRQQIDAAIAVTPFVIVPTDDLHEFASCVKVSLLSKMQECGFPTMSIETNGSSLYSRIPL
jgi:hypothetical protein